MQTDRQTSVLCLILQHLKCTVFDLLASLFDFPSYRLTTSIAHPQMLMKQKIPNHFEHLPKYSVYIK